ncbi:MAG: ComEA family DNA-binding protein [bacterium]
MPELSRSQLLVYGAVAVTVLLIGARWVRGADERATPAGDIAFAGGGGAAGESGGSGEGFEVSADGGEDVVVHVAGAVRDPGVFRLPAGSRVTDAVERAGGISGSAAADGVNLAARLADGQQILIPVRASGPAGAGSGVIAGVGGAATAGPISLGSATVEQLDTIEGIGPITAQNIIAFRDEHGGLADVDQLDEVSGIGPTTMDALRDRLQP